MSLFCHHQSLINSSSLLNTLHILRIMKAAKKTAAAIRSRCLSASLSGANESTANAQEDATNQNSSQFSGPTMVKRLPKAYIMSQITLALLSILMIATYILTGAWWSQALVLLLGGVILGLEAAPMLLKETTKKANSEEREYRRRYNDAHGRLAA